MSTYRRTRAPGGTFFFTVVTHDRRPLLADRINVDALREAFRRVKAVRPFEIEAAVVLPDHIHTLWRLPDGDSDFSSRWREIKKTASRMIRANIGERDGLPIWQRRFWEHLIRDDQDWRRHVDYIHFNPVKHGFTSRPINWPWSSFSQALERGWYDASWGETEAPAISGMDCE